MGLTGAVTPRTKGALMHGVRVAVAALAAVLIVTGCATERDHAPGGVYQLEPLPTNGAESHFSFPYGYESVEHLMTDASDVVVARPVSRKETPSERPGLAMTDVTFRVEQVLSGDFTSGQEIVVHYTGGVGTNNMPALPTHPKDGLQYLMMLTTWKIDGKTLYVTGPAQWVREFEDQRFALDVHVLEQLSSGSTVPLDTTVDEMQQELQRIDR